MALGKSAVLDQAQQMLSWRGQEQQRLDLIRNYVRNKNRLLYLPKDAPPDLQRLARICRVNVLRFIERAATQGLYVDGFRSREKDSPTWAAWQANGLDARQIGIHRAAVRYGAGYASALPGDDFPVVRGASPRDMTVVYGEDDIWPMWALEKRRGPKGQGQLWRLFDDTSLYWVSSDSFGSDLKFVSQEDHNLGFVPVIRYRDTIDLDDDVTGIIEPLFNLQDQINITTFVLLVAQHYGAHRQRWIIGWLARDEAQKKKASASELWTFDEDPDAMKIGEFEQTQTTGMIEHRESTTRLLATVSQTPVHELLGQLSNLSAEALIAARDSHNRALDESKVVLGEAHEQMLNTAGRLMGIEPDPSAYVRWRDMESRALGVMADALGKFCEMLGVPKRAMWEKAAEALGVSQQEMQGWEALAAEDDSVAQLTALLDRQMALDG